MFPFCACLVKCGCRAQAVSWHCLCCCSPNSLLHCSWQAQAWLLEDTVTIGLWVAQLSTTNRPGDTEYVLLCLFGGTSAERRCSLYTCETALWEGAVGDKKMLFPRVAKLRGQSRRKRENWELRWGEIHIERQRLQVDVVECTADWNKKQKRISD